MNDKDGKDLRRRKTLMTATLLGLAVAHLGLALVGASRWHFALGFCWLCSAAFRVWRERRSFDSPLIDSSAASDATDSKKTDGDGAPSEDKAQNKD